MPFWNRHQEPETAQQATPASVSLAKGHVVSLLKADGSSLEGVRMGLGWDPAKGVRSIDLDANCTAVNAHGEVLFTVSYRQLFSSCGSVRHTGDNLTGAGEGDDESILVDLLRLLQTNAAAPQVDAAVKALYFTVNAFSGQAFRKVANAHCHIVATVGGQDAQDLGTFNLSQAGGNHTALVMARIALYGGSWHAEMIGDTANGRVAADLEGAIKKHLQKHPIAA